MNASYSSLAAYLAHWRALKAGDSLSAKDGAILAQIDAAIGEILGPDARYLDEDCADSASRRHRDRAEAKLRRELIARDAITG